MNHEFKIIRKINTKGFSLIELLVVVSVIGVLSTLGIAGFSKYNDIQIVQAAANDVATTLNLAKSRALSQVKLGTCTFLDNLEKYEVKIDMSGSFNVYQLIIHCSGFLDTIENKTLPKNVQFITVGTTITSISFPVLAGGVEAGGQVEIGLPGGPTKKILIDSVGGIKIQ